MEGLILCQRYAEAQAHSLGLLEGADRLYLQAELSWRQGDLEVGCLLMGGWCYAHKQAIPLVMARQRSGLTAHGSEAWSHLWTVAYRS